MLIVFTKSIIVYLLLITTMRIMGKKQLGELQPFEFAISLIMAELACIPIADTTIPLSYGIVPILTMFVLEFIITKAVKHSIKIRKIVNGKPIIVINNDGIDYKALSNLDMTINDLLEAIRSCNAMSPSEVQYAIVETNGKMTVFLKAENRPVQVGDMNLQIQPQKLPYCMITEGKLMCENIDKLKLSKEKILAFVQQNKLRLKDVLLFTLNDEGEFYLQPINRKFQMGTFNAEQDPIDLQKGEV